MAHHILEQASKFGFPETTWSQGGTKKDVKQNHVEDDLSHQIISSLFIGPKSENLDIFAKNITVILDELKNARSRYFPDDKSFITPEIKQTDGYKQATSRLSTAVSQLANLMGRTSIPFWSPRYEAHMCTDMSMASLLGYFMTMLYNPNNVAIEASPFSTVIEMEVGEQLCKLLGYNIDNDNEDEPSGWGHITCGGTVANMESMWAARNLKFYPLSLQQAMRTNEALGSISDKFKVETCDGQVDLFVNLDPWQLLNLKSEEILSIPDRLQREHGISNTFLSKVLDDFSIQTTGKSCLEQQYSLIENSPQYFVATTRHYSWPKGAALVGIGSQNLVGVEVDNAARIDLDVLEELLESRLQKKQAVYAVVAVMGSTEEGAVDPLTSIVAMRQRFQKRGLSFLIHADAAWGGYFATMLPRERAPSDDLMMPPEKGEVEGFVPDSSLRTATQQDIYSLRFADSITLDPHKAGYIPYPAGSLCYRDDRMRYLVTWTSPYLSRGAVTSIGIYGIEGSKPGAAAVATWLANETIGLDPQGYGALQSEVTWTCSRLSAEWASLTDDDSSWICVPFNELPSETASDSTPEKIAAEKAFIKENIVSASNASIVAHDKETGGTTLKLLRGLGSDLNINAFSLNFRYSDGTVNTDIEEANYLMKRVVQAFSVDEPTDDPAAIPLYLTSTEFSDELYGKCKAHFMKRLQLDPSSQDLMVLRNVVMSPFPSDGGFIRNLAQIFERQVKKEVEVVRKRNEVTKDQHQFLVQGTDQVHLVHLPMFSVANHRQQMILKVDLHGTSKLLYDLYRKAHPSEPLILQSAEAISLQDVATSAENYSFRAKITAKASGLTIPNVTVEVLDIVANKSLASKNWANAYPLKSMPFYLYGTHDEANIDHIITRGPNSQFSSSGCKIAVDELKAEDWESPLTLSFEEVPEISMQPFPSNELIGVHDGTFVSADDRHFFFRPGAEFKISVWREEHRDETSLTIDEEGELIGYGRLTIGESYYIDTEAMNFDPFHKVDKVVGWRRELDQIGENIERSFTSTAKAKPVLDYVGKTEMSTHAPIGHTSHEHDKHHGIGDFHFGG